MMIRLLIALVLAIAPAEATTLPQARPLDGEPARGGPLALSLALYLVGTARVWQRAGLGRGVQRWQVRFFALGWVILVLALVTPLHWLGERLFTAHMIEHELLMAVAAPLIVIARPAGAMVWGLPKRARWIGRLVSTGELARAWGWLTTPLSATLAHNIALWVWHMPPLYRTALDVPAVHWLQHVSFLGTALLFWSALLRGRAHIRGDGAAIFYLFATALSTGLLGVLIALAQRVLFPFQSLVSLEWGLTPLEDQQLAGLVMWVPAGLVYVIAALALAARWITRSSTLERRPPHAAAHG